MANKEATLAIKVPRSLNSGSPLLEKAYSDWLQSLFDTKTYTFVRHDTPRYRAVVIAGVHRFVYDKKTGLLQSQYRTKSGGWSSRVRDKLPRMPSFWMSNQESRNIVREAWRTAVCADMPPAEACYPEGVPSKFTKRRNSDSRCFSNISDLYDSCLNIAVLRRLGAKNGQNASRGLIVALWNFLVDKDILRLCHAYFGRHASMNGYNFTVKNREQMERLSVETPSLTPLIGAYLVQMHAISKSANDSSFRIADDVVSVIKKHFMAGTHVDNNGKVSESKHEQLSAQAWRYLSHLKRSDIQTMLYHVRSDFRVYQDTLQKFQSRILPLMSLLAKNGMRPPMSLFKWMLLTLPRFIPVGPTVQLAVPEREIAYIKEVPLAPHFRDGARELLRLMTEKALLARKKGTLQALVKTDVVLLWDWFSDRLPSIDPDGLSVPDLTTHPVLTKQTTWKSAMRMQHVWHQNEAARQRARQLANIERYQREIAAQESLRWESLVSKQTIQGVQVKPLLTGKSLRIEGRVMKHCVGGGRYSRSCHRGDSRIFSLKDANCRATLELRKSRTKWHVGQLFSKGNKAVTNEVAAAAEVIASHYSKAEAKLARSSVSKLARN